MKQRYLPLYYEWHKRGYADFLCNYFNNTNRANSMKLEFSNNPLFELFLPTKEELAEHYKREAGQDSAWGANHGGRWDEFTELRQNIILLMACLNGEKL